MLVAAIGNGRLFSFMSVLTHDLPSGQAAFVLIVVLVQDGRLLGIELAGLIRATFNPLELWHRDCRPPSGPPRAGSRVAAVPNPSSTAEVGGKSN